MSRTKRKLPIKDPVKIKYLLRRPRTTQEKRFYFSAKYDGVLIRPSRTNERLPSAWDDAVIAARKEQRSR